MTRWSDTDQRAFRLLCEASGIGFWHIDVQGYTKYVNPTMCEMLELSSPADLDGKTHHEFFTAAATSARAAWPRRTRSSSSACEAVAATS